MWQVIYHQRVYRLEAIVGMWRTYAAAALQAERLNDVVAEMGTVGVEYTIRKVKPS